MARRLLLLFYLVNRLNYTHGLWTNTSDKKPETRVIGGSVLWPHSRPYLLHLGNDGDNAVQRAFCGAALVGRQWALTAAHCVYGARYGCKLRVTAGEHSLSFMTGNEQRVKVASVFIHPKYNDKTLENDVALLQLEQELDLIPGKVEVIPLNTDPRCPRSRGPKSNCLVMGWGATKWPLGYNTYPGVPHEAGVRPINNRRCRRIYPYYAGYRISRKNVCALEGGKDACAGDSGGPYVCPCGRGGALVHVGLVSWGVDCANPYYPGVYARTDAYVPWIQACITGWRCPHQGRSKVKQCYD